MPSPSLISPVGYSASSCGYCSPIGERSSSKSSLSYGLWAHQLSNEMYDVLMNRGWRRSGSYVYHPDMARTCCPQYTIRLQEDLFRPGKQLRRSLTRFNRWILTGSTEFSVGKPHPLIPKGKPGMGKFNQPFDLGTRLRLPEQSHLDSLNQPSPPAHSFSVLLHTASPPHPSVYPLYQRYQRAIHKDTSSLTFDSFSRFLCESPLQPSPIPYGPTISRLSPQNRELKLKELCLPPTFGGPWHLLYIVDGEVVAFSVLDFLPTGVSSVYFCYEPREDVARLALGKISALREANLVRSMRLAGVDSARYLYMGFYIHSCQKMRYKGRFQPSELLDPGTNIFHRLSPLVPTLEAHPRGYVPFDPSATEFPTLPASPSLISELDSEGSTSMSSDEDDDEDIALPSSPPPPSFLSTSDTDVGAVGRSIVFVPSRGPMHFENSRFSRDPDHLTSMTELMAALHGPGPLGPRKDGTGGMLVADAETIEQVGLVAVVLR